MSRKFYPKLKKYDIILILFICLGMWGWDKYQTYQKRQEERHKLEIFEKLQKDCLYGDNSACEKVYGSVHKKLD